MTTFQALSPPLPPSWSTKFPPPGAQIYVPPPCQPNSYPPPAANQRAQVCLGATRHHNRQELGKKFILCISETGLRRAFRQSGGMVRGRGVPTFRARRDGAGGWRCRPAVWARPGSRAGTLVDPTSATVGRRAKRKPLYTQKGTSRTRKLGRLGRPADLKNRRPPTWYGRVRRRLAREPSPEFEIQGRAPESYGSRLYSLSYVVRPCGPRSWRSAPTKPAGRSNRVFGPPRPPAPGAAKKL